MNSDQGVAGLAVLEKDIAVRGEARRTAQVIGAQSAVRPAEHLDAAVRVVAAGHLNGGVAGAGEDEVLGRQTAEQHVLKRQRTGAEGDHGVGAGLHGVGLNVRQAVEGPEFRQVDLVAQRGGEIGDDRGAGAGGEQEGVGPGPAGQGGAAAANDDQVVARPADDGVGPRSREDDGGPRASVDRLAVVAEVDDVGPAAEIDAAGLGSAAAVVEVVAVGV